MSIPAYVTGFLTKGYHTETTGTAITEELPANASGRLAVINGSYTTDDSAETLSFMYADGTGSRTTAASEAASGQADITTSEAPKDPAGNAAASGDVVAYRVDNGTWEFNTVSSVSGSTITFNNNLARKVLEGDEVNVIGAQGDGAEIQLRAAASGTHEFGNGEIAVVHPYKGEPMYLSASNSGTSDSQLDFLVLVLLDK